VRRHGEQRIPDSKGPTRFRHVNYVVAFSVLLIAGFASSTAFGRVLISGSDTGATSTAADPAATTSDATSTDTTNGTDTTSTATPASTEITTTTDAGTTTTTAEPPPGTRAPAFNPTLTTDKADYAPGSTVTLTGTGWGVGESIHLFVNDDMGQTWSLNADVLADAAGSFTYQFQLPNYFVSDYSVTATGTALEVVKTAFTDAVNFQFLGKDGAQHTTSGSEEDLGTVTIGTALAATCPDGLTVKGTGLGGSQSLGWAISYVSGYGSNGALSSPSSPTTISPSSGTFNGNGTQCITMSISTTGLSPGVYQGELQVARTSGASANTGFYFFRFTVAAATQATTASLTRTTGNSPSTFGDPLTFTATVTASGGDPSGVGTVTFKNGATTLCNAVPLSGNSATCSPSLAAGSYGITAEYSGTTSGSPQFQPSTSGPVAQTVNRANQIISVTTPAPASAAYNSSFAVAATGGGSGNPVTFSNAGSCSNSGATFTMTSGTGTCTVKYDQAGDANYNVASQVLEIVSATKASQTINVTTHPPASATYGSSFTVAATGGGSGNPVTLSSAGSCSNSGATFAMTGGSGTCTVTYDQAGNANYNAASQLLETVNATTASQTITFAALSNTTYGDPDFPVSASASSGLTVSFSVGATDNCTIAGSRVHIMGAGSCTVTASQGGNADYAAAPDVARSFTIAKSSQTISFDAPADHTYGDAPVTLDASASSGLPVELSADGPCTIIAGPKARVDGAGNCTITAAQPGNDNWKPAAPISHGFSIAKKPLTITASSPDAITYGDGKPAVSASYDGFISGDDADSLTAKPTCGTDYTPGVNVGSYITTCSGADSHNYGISYQPGSFTVLKKALTITASSPADIIYGSPKLAIDPIYDGFVSGDDADKLTTRPTCGTAYSAGDNVGTYGTACAGAASGNYELSYVPGSFKVTKKSLTITASSPADIVYGSASPPVTATASGLVTGDTLGDLNVSCTTPYSLGEAIGTYSTSCAASGGKSGNYDITYVNGSFKVTKKSLTITASSPADIVYGSSKPTVTAVADGLVAGNTLSDLNITCTSPYLAGDPIGTYATSCAAAGGKSGNYDIAYVAGFFNVNKKSLTITASSPADIVYGSSRPAVTPSANGLIAQDALSELNVSCTTPYSAGDPVGAYTTSCLASGGKSGNYDITYVEGSFNVTKKTLTITASSPADLTYGSAVPSVTPIYSGFISGQDAKNLLAKPTCGTSYTPASPVGTYATTCSGAASGNYSFTYVAGSFKVFYGWSGFLQPINDTAHFVNLDMSVFKAGSTVPVKFQLTSAAGNPVQAGTLPQWVTPTVVGTTSAPVDETVYADSPSTGSAYRWDGQQYIFNWQSPKNEVGKLYRIGVRLDDGKTYYVNIGLK
jgi:hypothetical protein